jgi:hypothetical protein
MEVGDTGRLGPVVTRSKSKHQSPSAGLTTTTTKRPRGKRDVIILPTTLPDPADPADPVVPFVNDPDVGRRSPRRVVTTLAPVRPTKRNLTPSSLPPSLPTPLPRHVVQPLTPEQEAELLKEQFKKEDAEEAEARNKFIVKEKEIVKIMLEEPKTQPRLRIAVKKVMDQIRKKKMIDAVITAFQEKMAETKKVLIQEMELRNEIEIKEQTNRRKRVAIDVAQSIEKEKEKPSSIPVFQEYNLMQIGDFILKQFPADAISVLDEFETLSPASRKEIVDFVILKCKAVTLNVSVDDAGVPDHVYNTLGIKSLSLLADDGMPSSARALMVCKPEPCPDAVAGVAGAACVAEWCCCIGSNTDFSDIADTILGQDSPFVTAHPGIRDMIESCRSKIHVQGMVGAAPAPGGDDPQGFGVPFPSVIIGSDLIVYSIGPIIDAESILGRPLIMIRIHNYKNEDYPNGIYFWVYPSFSEGGASRVFLIIGGRQFMKGPDYTLTTFIIDLLQVHINKYYAEHFVLKQGPGFSPTILSTQQEVICFFGGMIHLQTRWVHDLIAGRVEVVSVGAGVHGTKLNLGPGSLPAEPLGLVPPGFNRHCYTFDSSLDIKRWIVSGIDNVESPPPLGLSPQEAHLAEQFLNDNRRCTGQRSLASSFPLSCCLTTIFHKYGDERKTDVNDFFALFKRWPDTRFVQGCNVVPGVSPVGYVVAGTSSNLQGMRYNIFLEHLAPLEFVKRFKSLRLVQPIVTPDPGETFAMIGRMGRSGLLIKKRTLLGIETAQLETCLMVVDLAPAADEINKILKKRRRDKGPNALIYPREQEAIILKSLPEALDITIDKISEIFFSLPPNRLTDIKKCFKMFIGLPDCPWDNPDQFKHHIVIKSLDISRRNGLITSIAIIKDSPLYRLIRTLETGEYRHLIMSSMLDEYTGMVSFPLNITPSLVPGLNPRVSCAFLNSDGQYVELPGGFGEGSLGNCDFSGAFQHPSFNPYIFSATRKSMTFPRRTLEVYIQRPQFVTPDQAAHDATIPVKVHNKMFLIRLVFYTTAGAIQIVVCVSSTICIASPMGGPPSIPFGVDVQFNVVSIGPLRANEDGVGMSTDATILATMCDYLSLGCMGASKKGEYSFTSGSPQFFDYFDIFFKLINTECFTYVSAYMSPFNCGKDLVMKHFGRVFEDVVPNPNPPPNLIPNPISSAIRRLWNWFPYLDHVQPEVCSPRGPLTPQIIDEELAYGRWNMQVVVQVFFDPILSVLDGRAVGDETGHGEVEPETPGGPADTTDSDSGSSAASSLDNGGVLARHVVDGDTLSSKDSASWPGSSMGSSRGSDSSREPVFSMGSRDTYGGGRGRTNRKTRKRKYRINRRSKSKSKSKPKNTNIHRRTRKNTDVSRTRTKTMKIKRKKFSKRIYLYSTPRTAQRMAYKYLGRTKTAKLYPARNPAKKYMVYDPKNNKWVNFGQMGYEDYTKHHDKTRRKNYLTRTKGMLGDWKSNKYSANNLSRRILWT